ncbi:thymidylate synthase family protein [Sessilibacter sp. MAH4]
MNAISCQQAWQNMTLATEENSVRNYTQLLDMSDYLVETELFSKPVLEAYSAWNLEKEITEDQKQYFSNLRGGGQGDYRDGMQKKIANVVDCLTRFPKSKRAVITISNYPDHNHESDDQAKCMRELHFALTDDNKLIGTVFFRAQAALIFPKNIHFIGSVMSQIAEELPSKPDLGNLFYLATQLVSNRD